jgi:hypothetical protein
MSSADLSAPVGVGFTRSVGASLSARSCRAFLASASALAMSERTLVVEATVPPAATTRSVTEVMFCVSTPGSATTATPRPVANPETTRPTVACSHASRSAPSWLRAVTSARRPALSLRSWVISEVSVSPIWPWSGPAPSTIPTARARKIETMETRW